MALRSSTSVAFAYLVATSSGSALADTIHVPSEYPTIQAALSAADHGDEIVVADGTYSGPGFRDLEFGGLRVTVRSASGDPALCTLDCQQSGRAFDFDNDETAESIVEGFTIAYGFMLNYGGAMYIGDATPTIRNCVFYYCYADFDGGAVYVEDDSPSFVDCQFLNNFALGNGAGVGILNGSPSFSGCVFQGNTTYQDGGGARIAGGSACFTDCVFQDNEASGDGGGLHVFKAAPSIAGCSFNGNSASDEGGAMSVVTEDDFTVSTTIFTDNTASDGGALYFARAYLSPTMTLEDCTFSNNSITSPKIGGAITAAGQGGAIHVVQATLVLNGGLFDHNSTANDGGAIYNEGNLEATDAIFRWNSAARYGGAIAASVAGVTLTGCTLENNEALSDIYGGGALYSSETDLTMNGCTLESNTAQRTGGALCNSDSTATLTDCTFLNNQTMTGGEPLYTGGAAVANVVYGELTATNCAFTNNTSTESGGAILNRDESSAVVDSCAFEANQVLLGDGGAVISDATSSLDLSSCTFRDNQNLNATGLGGAVKGFQMTIADCLFIGNMAAYQAGAAYAGAADIVNCRFFGNHASEAGALLLPSSNTVVNCVFRHNSADTIGGAVRTRGGVFTFANCSFVGNSAGSSSGVVDSLQDDLILIHNSVLWSSTPEHFGPIILPLVSYSDVEGGYSGGGNIDVDPLFMDPDGPDNIPGTEDDDLRLLPGSPCIDAADNTAVPSGVDTDLDGNPRFIDDPDTADTGVGYPCVDMGAYEYPSCKEDINRDGVVDIDDLFEVLAHWNEGAGRYDVNSDSYVDIDDIFEVLAHWGPCE